MGRIKHYFISLFNQIAAEKGIGPPADRKTGVFIGFVLVIPEFCTHPVKISLKNHLGSLRD
jgi:hypothetical protein